MLDLDFSELSRSLLEVMAGIEITLFGDPKPHVHENFKLSIHDFIEFKNKFLDLMGNIEENICTLRKTPLVFVMDGANVARCNKNVNGIGKFSQI